MSNIIKNIYTKQEILFSTFRLVPLLTSLLRLNPIINHISLGDEKNSR